MRDDCPAETAALQTVAEKLGIGSRETLRNWVKQHENDAGQRMGTTTEESVQLKALMKENAELGRANEILKAPATFPSPGVTSTDSLGATGNSGPSSHWCRTTKL